MTTLSGIITPTNLVTATSTTTLTNKTISGASNTLTNIPLNAGVTGTLPVANGGTGDTTFTNGQLLIGNTTGNTLTKAALTAGTNVTITNGSGAITIAASGGAFGTDLSFEDYSLTVSSAIVSTAAAQIFMQAASLDGTSELMIIYGSSSAHAVVWNSSTNTFGTPVLVRTGSLAARQNVALTKISSTAVLVCSLPAGTALETVVLTVSGSTITVGTALATTLGASGNLIAVNTRLVTVGSSYVLNYEGFADNLPKFRAITVSGSTPSIGAELAYAGGTLKAMHHSYAHSASVLLHFSMTASTTVFVLPIAVSGTTLTAGTAATVSTTSASFMVTGALSSSRYALAYLNTTGRGAVVSVAGTVASISTAATTMALTTWSPSMQVFSNQAFILPSTSAGDDFNVLTDTAGVATLGTSLTNPVTNSFSGFLSTGKVFLASSASGQTTYFQYGISAGSAVLEKSFPNVTSTSSVSTGVPGLVAYVKPLSGPPQSGSGDTPISLKTSTGKMVVSNTVFPFVASIDGTNPAKLQQSANPFSSYNDGISEAVVWGIPTSQAASTTTVQLRKVTLV